MTSALVAEIARSGRRLWAHGTGPSRKALEAILRYHHEQDITLRQFTIEELLFLTY